VCAICVETVQGEGGIRPVNPEFLRLARKLTKSTGALLILDEIQCGLGRTGGYFAYQHYGIRPDIVTVAKPLAAGLPLGAILTTNRVATAMHPGMHGTTFGGGPLASAVAIQFLRLMERLMPHVRTIGDYFRAQLDWLKAKHGCVREVRGMGLMLGMELNSADTAKQVVSQMMQRGILINRTNETVLRFLPPYIVEKKHVDQVIRELDAALTSGSSTGVSRKAQKSTARSQS
jgi:acetylornithine/N-succinyldiaminopimelate aminotransferase